MTDSSATAFFRQAAHQPDELMHVDDVARMRSEYGNDQHGKPITMGHVAQWDADGMANDRYEPEHLHALVNDVRKRGIEHPIHLAHDSNQEPYVRDGTHRYWAAAKAGLSHVPVRWSEDYLSDEQGLADGEGWRPPHTATAFFRQATARGVDSEGHDVELDPQDGWQHLDGSVSHDDGTTVSDGEVHTAAAVDNSGGVMVALVPPREIAEQLVREDGQLVEDLHVTMAYLGKSSDYTPEQLKLLPQIVSSWALRQKPVSLRIAGTGKFNNSHKGESVLYAAVDIPGGAQLHADLARYLQGHGYNLPSEHGWTPHLTLAYVDRHFRFMPHLDEHRWTAEYVVTEVGRTRHQARLGTIPSGRHAL